MSDKLKPNRTTYEIGTEELKRIMSERLQVDPKNVSIRFLERVVGMEMDPEREVYAVEVTVKP